MDKNIKINETMGDRIRNKRICLHMTQEKLAEAMYVSKVAISQYENNLVDIKCSTLVELSGKLMTTPDYLLTGNESMPTHVLKTDTAQLLCAFEQISDEKIRRLILAQVETALAMEVK